MNHNVGISFGNGRHKFINQRIILCAAQTPLRQANVKRIVQQFFVFRADVQGDGQRSGGIDARAGGVERQLAYGNAHPVDAQIAQTQNALAVGDHNHFYVIMGPVGNNFGDAPFVLSGDVEAAGAAENVGIFLTRLANGGCVDDGHHIFQIVHHQPVKQGFVAVFQANEVNIFFHIAGFFAVIFQRTLHLSFL